MAFTLGLSVLSSTLYPYYFNHEIAARRSTVIILLLKEEAARLLTQSINSVIWIMNINIEEGTGAQCLNNDVFSVLWQEY